MDHSDQVMAYLAISFAGNWQKMLDAMKRNFYIDEKMMKEQLHSLHCNYVSIVNQRYPSRWDYVENGPMIIFYSGNYQLLNEKSILVVSHLNKVNLKYLKCLKNHGVIPVLNANWLDQDDYFILEDNHLPFILCVPSLKYEMNDYLKRMINQKQALVISESVELDHPDYVWWQYPRLLCISRVILFLSDYYVREQNFVDYVKNQKIKSFVICNSSSPQISKNFCDISIIHSLNNFQIVINYLNENY